MSQYLPEGLVQKSRAQRPLATPQYGSFATAKRASAVDDFHDLLVQLMEKNPNLSVQDLKAMYEEYKKNPTKWKLREGVDFSEGGWATDKAVAVVAFLFFVSSLSYGAQGKHWGWMMGGTAVAHLFGGLAHKYFPNRATKGEGMVGFYVTMIVGYGGNCARFGMGWGLPGLFWPMVAVFTWLWLLGTGIFAIATMKRTKKRFVVHPENIKDPFLPDILFSLGELLCLVGEVASCIMFVSTINASKYAILAVIANLVGWVSVYVPGILNMLTGFKYDPSLSQRIFHYAMLVMVWSIDAIAGH